MPSEVDPKRPGDVTRVAADSPSVDGAPRGVSRSFALTMAAAVVVLGFGLLASLTGKPIGEGTTAPVASTVPTSLWEPSRPLYGIPDPGNPSVASITPWIAGDSGADPLPLGEGGPFLGNLYLDFLTEGCWEDRCFRDAVTRNLDDSEPASEPFDDYGFVVRHGFLNSGEEPLGEGYAVDVYIRKEYSGVAEGGVFEVGTTYKFTADYVARGTAERCGPTYKDQSGPVECEWFVHEFPNGLPAGRYDLWAVWHAPCSAWLAMGLTDSCVVETEVLSLFSAAVNSPFQIEGN